MAKKITDKSAPGDKKEVSIPSQPTPVRRVVPKQGRLLGSGVVDDPAMESSSDHFPSPAANKAYAQTELAIKNVKESPKKIQAAASQGSRAVPSSLKFVGMFLISIALIASVLVYLRQGSDSDAALFEEQWFSNDAAKMQSVAERAFAAPQSSAAEVIVDEALRGEKHPPVRDHLLRTAYRREWERELSPRDRETLLRVALLGLAPSAAGAIVVDSTLHPGAIFALLADLPEDAFSAELSKIPLSKLFTLPGIFGESFKAMEALAVSNCDEKPVRAMAALTSGIVTAEVLRAYFSTDAIDPEQAEAIMVAKFRILLGWVSRFEKLGPLMVEFAEQQSAILSERLRWFEEEHQEFWSNVPLVVKLTLSGGTTPALAFSFEQTSDLLQFPSSTVRKDAARRLSPVFHRSMAAPLAFLAGTDHQFSRSQVVLLLSALRLEGDAAMPFISGWFVTNPGAGSVVAFLAETSRTPGLEIFNLEAGRYLKRTEWSATRAQLRVLVFHPEPIIRALAYSKLQPANQDDMTLLKKALAVEQDPKLRESLREKVENRLGIS